MSAGNLLCRLCGEPNKFVKSHIIGRSFFPLIMGPFKHAIEVDLDAKTKACLQAGNYDKQMLCEKCEPKFSQLDNYGHKLLRNPDLSRPILSHSTGRTVQAYRFVGCDTDKLRKFVLSVLWRASVSSLDFYSYVRLGPVFELEIIEKVFSPDVLPWDEFTILISKIDDNALGPYGNMLFPPVPLRDPVGINFYCLYLPGLKITIKVDHRPTPFYWWVSAIQHPSQFEMMRLYGSLVSAEWGYLKHMSEKLRSGNFNFDQKARRPSGSKRRPK
jgi:hypothetical protein